MLDEKIAPDHEQQGQRLVRTLSDIFSDPISCAEHRCRTQVGRDDLLRRTQVGRDDHDNNY